MSAIRPANATVAAALVVAAGAAILVVPTTAGAAPQSATVHVDRACYSSAPASRPPMTITAGGFTAGARVVVTDGLGAIDVTATADAAGEISVAVRAPVPSLNAPGVKRDTITATQSAPTDVVGTTTAQLTRPDLGHSAGRPAPGLRALTEQVRWSFSGFPTGRVIWGHYTHDGRLVARQAFGRAQGPCGLLTVRKRVYPATPHHSIYTIQADADRRYSRRTTPSSRLTLQLTVL